MLPDYYSRLQEVQKSSPAGIPMCLSVGCHSYAKKDHDFCFGCLALMADFANRTKGFDAHTQLPTLSTDLQKIAEDPVQSIAVDLPETDETLLPEIPMSKKYPKYYKDVSHLNELDVYQVHNLFRINDFSGCIQHASKKLLLSGNRNGGKSFYQDIKEARDTLNRWLAINQETAAA